MAASTPVQAPMSCRECDTANLAGARFCKSCGAAIAPPATCPSCGATTEADRRDCPECDALLLGPRPSNGKGVESHLAEAKDREVVKAATAALPTAQAPSSNIMGNVMLFMAFVSILIVLLYVMNRDAPKEHNPFTGGPPPVQKPRVPEEVSASNQPTTPTPPPATANAPSPFTGTIQLREGLTSDASRGVLYVIVRRVGESGVPVAVRRIMAPKFPMPFSIGPSEVMMEDEEFDGPFDVTARLDRDGNAETSEAGDLSTKAPVSGVKPGDTNVVIVLEEKI